MPNYRMDPFYYRAGHDEPIRGQHILLVAGDDAEAVKEAHIAALGLPSFAYFELRTMNEQPRLVHRSPRRRRDA